MCSLDFSELEKQLTDFVDRSTIEENLRTQLAEFEMLQSMYSSPKEILIDNPDVISELQDYCNGRGTSLPPQLDFHLFLTIECHKFDFNVNLPLEYPTHEPDIYIRSDSLCRTAQHSLNDDVSRFISSLPRDEMCVLSAISWLQDNAINYVGRETASVRPTPVRHSNVEAWARLWIYSHHIYSKSKRKELMELAQEFHLTGFCLPGRPGIICYEGAEVDCDQCWNKVKSMNWKKIMCVKKETEMDGRNLDGPFRRFSQFQEVCFEGGGKVRGRDYHMDFGEFYRFLCDSNCEYAFKDIFGIEGKIGAL